MNAVPEPSVSSGTSFPAAIPTASAVNPLRHHARYVRSFASRVLRVASSTSGAISPMVTCDLDNQATD
jgi:hypothetical protein